MTFLLMLLLWWTAPVVDIEPMGPPPRYIIHPPQDSHKLLPSPPTLRYEKRK